MTGERDERAKDTAALERVLRAAELESEKEGNPSAVEIANPPASKAVDIED